MRGPWPNCRRCIWRICRSSWRFSTGAITQGGSFREYLSVGVSRVWRGFDSQSGGFGSLCIPRCGSKKADAGGEYKDQVAAIKPLSSGLAAASENDPVLEQGYPVFFRARNPGGGWI